LPDSWNDETASRSSADFERNPDYRHGSGRPTANRVLNRCVERRGNGGAGGDLPSLIKVRTPASGTQLTWSDS
jgi:hypothetical protein